MLNKLKNIGMPDKEAKVYLAMLELGPSTMLEIASKADINRPTAYVQIEALKKKGLVSTQTKGKKTLFIAESPEQLKTILDREAKEIKGRKEELSDILPELKTLFNLSDEKPQVRFFEGKEGLLQIQKDFLKSKSKTILAIANIDDVKKLFPDITDNYGTKRIKSKIHSYLIYTTDTNLRLPSKKDELRETKFIDRKKMPFSADITIYDNKVAISSLRDKISGTIISHRDIAQSFSNLFWLIWKNVK